MSTAAIALALVAGAGVASGGVTPSVCSPALASQPQLGHVSTVLPLSGNPFGVVTTADGKWAFVSQLDGRLAVLDLDGARPTLRHEIALPGVMPTGLALSHDGRYLFVAAETATAVVSVDRAERGAPDAVLGQLAGGDGAIEVAVAPDDRFVFVSLESANEIAVFDLERALHSRFRRSGLVGAIPLGFAVVGMAVSPDGRWLYATSEVERLKSRRGSLSVIDLRRAETRPRRSLVARVVAGCDPVRVAVSSDGRVVWVTARESNSLLAFSARKLRTDAGHALLARVRVGTAPVGLALVRNGSRIVVADSNRFDAPGARSGLTVVDVTAALAHKAAVLGAVPAGTFPRELSFVPRRHELLVTDFGSDQLQVVDASRLP